MSPVISPAWEAVSRFGEAQLVLPAIALAGAWIARQADVRALAMRWLVLLGVAVALTTATKLAFIGWGLGSAALDFTGVSGHAMFAAASWPLMLRLAFAHAGPGAQRLATAAGIAIALLVAVSRVEVAAHSVSEIVAGGLLGGAVAGLAWPHWRVRDVLPSFALAGALLLWFVLHLPWGAAVPKVDTHGRVTQLALWLSGRDVPFSRQDLHRN